MSPDRQILLVEDEPVIVTAATRSLRPEGFQVDEAVTVPEALERLNQQSYSLVLCDLMLPGISGLELVKAVARDHAPLPVILITGYVTLDNALDSFNAGAFDFIPKPFDIDELLGVVQRGVAHYEARLRGEPLPPDPQDDRYFLGKHSWARPTDEGLFTVGVGRTFPHRLGKDYSVECPAVDSEVLQGNWCAKFRSPYGPVNRVWAPLSGKVVAVNELLQIQPSRIDSDPMESGWLIKLLPTNLNPELTVLHKGRRS